MLFSWTNSRSIFTASLFLVFTFFSQPTLSQVTVSMLQSGQLAKSITGDTPKSIPKAQLPALSKKFGGKIIAASQQAFDVSGSRVKLTGIRCASKSDRTKVFVKYVELYGDKLAILLADENSVYELSSLDVVARQKVTDLLPTVWKSQAQRLKGGEYPALWRLQRDSTLSDRQVKVLGGKLGVEIVDGVNQHFQLPEGGKVQVNTLAAKNIAAAQKLHKVLTKMVGTQNEVRLNGVAVQEIISADQTAKQLTLNACERRKSTAYYRVEYHVAPIAEGDAMKFTPAFNAFLQHRHGTQHEKRAAEKRVLDFGKAFKFTSSMGFQRSSRSHFQLNHTFEPAPESQNNASEDIVHVSFRDLPKRLSFPTAKIVVDYEVNDRFLRTKHKVEPLDDETRQRLTKSTPSWPIDDAQIQKAVARVVKGQNTDLGKAKAIQATVFRRIKFAGDKKGSRYGVKNVLKQRFGHCWDKSDVYVTMARAAGIPTRQVAGWVVGQSGHVWSESYLEGLGWMPIDATADQIGVSKNYLPLFSTDDGNMKFVYTDMPLVTQLAQPSD